MNRLAFCLSALLASVPAAPAARADELWSGIYVHDVRTPFNRSGIEEGAAVQLGWRGRPIEALRVLGRPAPHAFVSLSTAGNTHFAVLGIGWRLGGRLYARPGIGIAVHDGPGRRIRGDDRIDFGSRLLFAPELAVGWQASERWSVEASWVHLSHAQLLDRQNPGVDNLGVRLVYRLR